MKKTHGDNTRQHVSRRDWMAGAAALTAGAAALGAAIPTSAAQVVTEAQEGELAINNLVQLAFVVRDVEASAKRFANMLGLKMPAIVPGVAPAEAHTIYRGKPTLASLKMVFFRFQSLTIEFIQPVGNPSIWQEVLDKKGEGAHHIAFRVSDVTQTLEALTKRGFETAQTGDTKNGRYAYVDTMAVMGIMLELLGPAKA